MTAHLSVLLVAPDSRVRERATTALESASVIDVTAVPSPEAVPAGTTADGTDSIMDFDCLVGIPAENAIEMAHSLGGGPVPVVMFVDTEVDVTELLSTDVDDIVRDTGEEDYALLAHRVRRVAELSDRPGETNGGTDGGSTDGRTDGGTTDGRAGRTAVEAPLERVSAGVFAVDAEWRLTYVNEAAERLFDISRDAVLGEEILEAVPKLREMAVSDRWRAVVEDGVDITVEEYSESLGRWFEINAYPAADGLTLLVRDVTEQKRIREQRAESERALERLHEIASNTELTIEDKIGEMLAFGCERLGVSDGFLTRITAETQEIIQAVGDHDSLEPGETTPLEEAYCRRTIQQDDPLTVTAATTEGWEDDPAFERFGLGCYFGVAIDVGGEQYGTVCFADTEERPEPFTAREQTFMELLTDWIRELLERQTYERELEQQQAFTQSIIDSLPDPLYVFDENEELLRWNDRLEAVLGYDRDEIGRIAASDIVVEGDRERVTETMERVWDGEQTSVEATIETDDGELIPYELSGAPLHDEDGSVVGVTGIGRDMTAQQAHQRRLSGLLESTRSLMQARDREHVAEIAVNAAASILDFDTCLFRLYDSDSETLEPAAATDAVGDVLGDRPVYAVGEGNPGEVFATGEPLTIEDIEAAGEMPTDLGEVRSVMYHPVGVHGTISVASTEPDAFDETDEQMLALLSTTAAAACMRAKRESEVREAREHTEQVLDRINGLLENTIEVLVQATTREEIESGVVAELATTEPYSFAWIGQPDVTSESLSPTEMAGHATLPIQGHEFALSRGDDPVSDAYRTETLQVVERLDALDGGPWSELAANSSVESMVVVPLVYKDTNYGVVAVFADEPAAFDEREQVVLNALGRAIANAINAVERGRILDATEVIELEFAIDDRDLLFSRLSATADCRLEAAGTEYRSDGNVRLYVTAHDADAAELLELVRGDPAVLEATCIVEHDNECLLEIVVAESLLATLTEYGAVPKEMASEGGTTTFTVELPYEAEARELFELVEDRYPGTNLLGYHEREREVETRQEFRAALEDRLTDRQETAIRTAFLGGFFDWPREVDGNELAEAMDISRPTYHQHLRAAQRKVLEELFE